MVKKMSGSSKYEFISENRNRRITLKNRKKSLIKKIEQLSILCGIDVGAIIFPNDVDAEHGKQQLIVWPQDHTKIQELISLYKAKAGAGCDAGNSSDKSCDSSSEDSKIAKSWYDDLSVQQLNQLVQIVERRIGAVDNKIDFLRRCEGMQMCGPPESVSKLSHRCRHAVHCCCRGCGVVDPGCSHHRGVNITLHGACNSCVPNQMVRHSNHI